MTKIPLTEEQKQALILSKDLEILDENKALAIYLMEHPDETVWDNIQDWSGLTFKLTKD